MRSRCQCSRSWAEGPCPQPLEELLRQQTEQPWPRVQRCAFRAARRDRETCARVRSIRERGHPASQGRFLTAEYSCPSHRLQVTALVLCSCKATPSLSSKQEFASV